MLYFIWDCELFKKLSIGKKASGAQNNYSAAGFRVLIMDRIVRVTL